MLDTSDLFDNEDLESSIGDDDDEEIIDSDGVDLKLESEISRDARDYEDSPAKPQRQIGSFVATEPPNKTNTRLNTLVETPSGSKMSS